MIQMNFDGWTFACDFARDDQGLLRDPTLFTAVVISLFTDRRARDTDVLPDNQIGPDPLDRRGWVGDVIAWHPNDQIGSRLWLICREKQTETTRKRAEHYAREALAWLITDRAAESYTVTAEWDAYQIGILKLLIVINIPAGGTERYWLKASLES